jgi:hypothetical protein
MPITRRINNPNTHIKIETIFTILGKRNSIKTPKIRGTIKKIVNKPMAIYFLIPLINEK